MKLFRVIAMSNKEPTDKNVCWLDTRNGQYKLKFWRDFGWADIYRDLHLNPDDYLSKLDASRLYQPKGTYVLPSELLGYYTKEETYSKEEIETLVHDVASFEIKVVEELPEVGEKNTIYLVPSKQSKDNTIYSDTLFYDDKILINEEESNSKDEYLWIGDKWELIGTTKLDLTSYATKQWIEDKDYINTTQLNDVILNKITKEQADTWYQPIGDYALNSSIPTKVSQLVNDAGYLTTIPEEYLTSTELSTTLQNYATTTQLNDKVDKVEGKSLISDTEIQRLSSVTNYNDSELRNSINNLNSTKADKTQLNGLASEEWVNKQGFITSIPSEYVTEEELNSKNYVNNSQLNTKVLEILINLGIIINTNAITDTTTLYANSILTNKLY